MPALKSLIRQDEPDRFILQLQLMKANFETYCSNYAIKVAVDDQIINFVKNEQSNAAFAGFSKLKRDLKDTKRPNIEATDVTYFLHDFKEPVYIERVVNLDLKSAYANILYMDKLISKDTHKYLGRLKKQERLSAVGMLASRKEVFEYLKGEIVSLRTERSEFAPFFFYAVKRTFEIMSELKKICGNAYLFTWVDGIYFLPDPGIKKECEDYLKMIGFPYSGETLNEFEVQFLPRSIKVSFLKQDNPRRKYFDLPMQESAYQKLVRKEVFIHNKKHRK
jgi:hypothetical protein